MKANKPSEKEHCKHCIDTVHALKKEYGLLKSKEELKDKPSTEAKDFLKDHKEVWIEEIKAYSLEPTTIMASIEEKAKREKELNQAISMKLVGVIGTISCCLVIASFLMGAWYWRSYWLLGLAGFQALALPSFINIWKSTWGIKGIDLLRELKALRRNGNKKNKV